ncbi:MAG: flagellar hook-associated protein FlgL [Thiomonas sp.]
MRISTSQFYAASLTGILNQQNTLNTLSQQLATGSSLVNPSDQPVAAAQNVTLTGQINRLATYTQNGQNAQNALQLESATLQSVGTLVDQVRQLAVQMNNGTVSSQDLQNAAATMQGYVQQLAQYANTQDGQGNYLFAGSKSGTQPFIIQANGSVLYQGDGSQNQLALGPSLNTAISDPGCGQSYYWKPKDMQLKRISCTRTTRVLFCWKTTGSAALASAPEHSIFVISS